VPPLVVPTEAPRTAVPTLATQLPTETPMTPAPTPMPTTATPSTVPTEILLTECFSKPSQVMIALDGSGSTSPDDFGSFMAFTDKLIENLPIADGKMGVGLLEFGTKTTLVQALSNDKDAVLQSRQRLQYEQGMRTYMSKAISDARNMLSNAAIPRTLVLITDGLPSDRSTTNEQLHAAKAEGINVVLVTVGFLANMNEAPTEEWLARPTIKVSGFPALSGYLSQIVDSIATGVCSFAPAPTALPASQLPDSKAPSQTPYCLSTGAQCGGPCGGVLSSITECEKAAAMLRIESTLPRVQMESTNNGAPHGCYMYNGADFPHGVYFNAAGTLQSTQGAVKAICLDVFNQR